MKIYILRKLKNFKINKERKNKKTNNKKIFNKIQILN